MTTDAAALLSASVHAPVDGVSILSFGDGTSSCFSYIADVACSEDAVSWFLDEIPESAFLSLALGHLGPELVPSKALPKMFPLPAYDWDFVRGCLSGVGLPDLGSGPRFAAALGTSALSTSAFLRALPPHRWELIESIRTGEARDARHSLVASVHLHLLAGGRPDEPMEIADLTLTSSELETLTALAPEWRDTPDALVATARAL